MTQRPPITWLLAYRLLGVRLPEEYRAWVAEDVTSKMFVTYRVTRTFLWLLAAVGLYAFAQAQVYRAPSRIAVQRLVMGALAVSLLASGKTLVRRTLQWQRVDRHGHPVRPRRLAVLSNTEAVVLSVAMVVVFTGGAAVWANGLSDTATCHEPDDALVAQLKAGFKKKDISLVSPQSVKFSKGEVIATFYLSAGDAKPTFVAFTVENGKVYELRSGVDAKSAPTTFPPLTDQASFGALKDAVSCLGKAAPR